MNINNKEMYRVLRMNDDKLGSEMELAIKFGKLILIENVGESLNPELDPILEPQLKIKGKNKILKLGDKEIDYNEDFRFYMTSSLPNPY